MEDQTKHCVYCIAGKRHDCHGAVFDCPWCSGTSLRAEAGGAPTGKPQERCPCEGDEEPGPHIPACPWADPDYDDGFMDDMPDRTSGGRVSIEHQCKVLRVVALHGPLREHALACWHIEGASHDEVHAAMIVLREAGRIDVSVEGLVDVRGVDRSRWALMSDAEKHARVDAIEAAVRVALGAAEVHRRLVAQKPLAALDSFASLMRDAAAGLVAAARADAAKERK